MYSWGIRCRRPSPGRAAQGRGYTAARSHTDRWIGLLGAWMPQRSATPELYRPEQGRGRSISPRGGKRVRRPVASSPSRQPRSPRPARRESDQDAPKICPHPFVVAVDVSPRVRNHAADHDAPPHRSQALGIVSPPSSATAVMNSWFSRKGRRWAVNSCGPAVERLRLLAAAGFGSVGRPETSAALCG
jgi:hypothetical protein